MELPPELLQRLQRARRVVVFTGAGVSAESGIPTFRDALTGLWARFDAERLATPQAFRADPELVWGWYEWRRMRVVRAAPNAAHHAIACLEKRVPTVVVTQNVDDLHERAGSRDPIHLHGSLFARRCGACGDAVRPGVVWFGEALPAEALQRAFDAAAGCDVLFSIGTSSLVHPAAQVPHLAKRAGACVVQVNPNPTPLDALCDYNLRGPAATVLPELLAEKVIS